MNKEISRFIKVATFGIGLAAALHPSVAIAQEAPARVEYYTQCGTPSGKVSRDKVVLVEKLLDRFGNVIKFIENDPPLGALPGQCDNPEDPKAYYPVVYAAFTRSNPYEQAYGEPIVPVVCPSWADSFRIKSNRPYIGTAEVSGGLQPSRPSWARLFVSSSIPDGRYTGEVTISCVTELGTELPYSKVGFDITVNTKRASNL